MKFIPFITIAFILTGAFLTSCESELPNKPYDTCQNPCDTCIPCDTCDTTQPCDTCDTTDPTPKPNDTTSHDFAWTEYTIPGEVNITGCAVFDTSIYVIGTYLYRFTGSGWEKLPVVQAGTGRSLSFPDFTMFGLAPDDIWIVQGGILDHYTGDQSSWGHSAEEFRPTSTELGSGAIACWGTSSNDMFFVGKNGSIAHFNGTAFTKFPQVTTKILRSVWGTSHNNVWASGYNDETGESVLLHYDGTSWSEQNILSHPLNVYPGASGHALDNVWAVDSAGHKIVIASGSLIWRRTNNKAWRSDSAFLPNAAPGGGFIGVGAMHGNSVNDFMAVGPWGWVGHWNGRSWKKYETLYDYGNPYYGAAAFDMKGNTACVVGVKSGQSWIAIGRRTK